MAYITLKIQNIVSQPVKNNCNLNAITRVVESTETSLTLMTSPNMTAGVGKSTCPR